MFYLIKNNFNQTNLLIMITAVESIMIYCHHNNTNWWLLRILNTILKMFFFIIFFIAIALKHWLIKLLKC